MVFRGEKDQLPMSVQRAPASTALERSGDARLRSLESLISQRGIVKSDGQLRLDLRPLLLDGRALGDIAEMFWERFGDAGPLQICGLEPAPLSLMAAIVLEGERTSRKINAFVICEERRTDGLARDLEGEINEEPIVVIDDSIARSDSLEKIAAVLADHGRRFERTFVVADCRSRRANGWLEDQRVEVVALFDRFHLGLPALEESTPAPAYDFTPAWSSAAPGPNHSLVAPRSSPVCDGRNILVGTDGGELRAIDAETGALMWSFKAPGSGAKGIWSSPALHDGQVLFGAHNGSLYCLDKDSGRPVWQAELADWIDSSPAIAAKHGLALIGLGHEAPGTNGSIAAVRVGSGELAWHYPATHGVHASPTLSDDESRIFIGTDGGDLLCLETVTGSCLWQYQSQGPIRGGAAYSVDHDVVIAGSADHYLHVIDGRTGRGKAIVRMEGAVQSAPLIVGDIAFAGCQDKTLHAIDLVDGRIIKSLPLGARILATPVLLNGLVYVGTTAGKLFGVDPVTLAVRDVLQLPDRVVNPPVLASDGRTLVVPVLGNRLFAFRMTPTASLPLTPTSGTQDQKSTTIASAPFVIDGAIADGSYFRIAELAGRVATRPFPSLPSLPMIGCAALLMARSPGYRDLTQADFSRRILPALLVNQARVFLYGRQPVGMVTWACLTEEAEARFAAKAELPDPEQWRGGDRVWIIDVVAPFGGSRAMLDKVRRESLRGREIRMLQPQANGGHGVVTLVA
jgi:outer membrane protein assembly factor BamB/hemolysin-activating ACP:hemolysin acyltransferase